VGGQPSEPGTPTVVLYRHSLGGAAAPGRDGPDFPLVGTAVIGLVAAVIGAAAGLIASYITARQQRLLEVHRLEAQLDAERDREVRLAVGEFSTEMSRVLQTLSWFTWQAANRRAVVNPTWVDAYDAEMRTQQPPVMAALSKLAALSPAAYARFEPLVSEMFEVDAQVASAGSVIDTEPNVARAQIAEYDTPADDLFKRFQRELASWALQ
jgi:hypothetical protein